MITWLIFELRLFCYCHFLISCGVSFVLRCFYNSHSCFLCCGENCKTFCLAELWQSLIIIIYELIVRSLTWEWSAAHYNCITLKNKYIINKPWPCINTHHASKILDLNACHVLPLQIQLSGSFELKLQNFTLLIVPFRRTKKTNEQSLHWLFRIHWDFTINAIHAFQNTKNKLFWFHTRVL